MREARKRSCCRRDKRAENCGCHVIAIEPNSASVHYILAKGRKKGLSRAYRGEGLRVEALQSLFAHPVRVGHRRFFRPDGDAFEHTERGQLGHTR